ncbi:hypothetical protein KIPB_006073, partial [Kipferlia bialata]|eukprot:g6073.t1
MDTADTDGLSGPLSFSISGQRVLADQGYHSMYLDTEGTGLPTPTDSGGALVDPGNSQWQALSISSDGLGMRRYSVNRMLTLGYDGVVLTFDSVGSERLGGQDYYDGVMSYVQAVSDAFPSAVIGIVVEPWMVHKPYSGYTVSPLSLAHLVVLEGLNYDSSLSDTETKVSSSLSSYWKAGWLPSLTEFLHTPRAGPTSDTDTASAPCLPFGVAIDYIMCMVDGVVFPEDSSLQTSWNLVTDTAPLYGMRPHVVDIHSTEGGIVCEANDYIPNPVTSDKIGDLAPQYFDTSLLISEVSATLPSATDSYKWPWQTLRGKIYTEPDGFLDPDDEDDPWTGRNGVGRVFTYDVEADAEEGTDATQCLVVEWDTASVVWGRPTYNLYLTLDSDSGTSGGTLSATDHFNYNGVSSAYAVLDAGQEGWDPTAIPTALPDTLSALPFHVILPDIVTEEAGERVRESDWGDDGYDSGEYPLSYTVCGLESLVTGYSTDPLSVSVSLRAENGVDRTGSEGRVGPSGGTEETNERVLSVSLSPSASSRAYVYDGLDDLPLGGVGHALDTGTGVLTLSVVVDGTNAAYADVLEDQSLTLYLRTDSRSTTGDVSAVLPGSGYSVSIPLDDRASRLTPLSCSTLTPTLASVESGLATSLALDATLSSDSAWASDNSDGHVSVVSCTDDGARYTTLEVALDVASLEWDTPVDNAYLLEVAYAVTGREVWDGVDPVEEPDSTTVRVPVPTHSALSLSIPEADLTPLIDASVTSVTPFSIVQARALDTEGGDECVVVLDRVRVPYTLREAVGVNVYSDDGSTLLAGYTAGVAATIVDSLVTDTSNSLYAAAVYTDAVGAEVESDKVLVTCTPTLSTDVPSFTGITE